MKEIYFVIFFCMALTLNSVFLGFLNMRVLPDKTPFIEKMIVCSCIFATTFLYWAVFRTLRCVIPAKWLCGYKASTNQSENYEDQYVDMNESATTQIVNGRPRLRLNDVWVIVYGVGLSYFCINYIFSCRDLLVSTMFTYALILCIGTDIVTTSVQFITFRNIMIFIASCICSISFGINFADNDFLAWKEVFNDKDIFSLIFRIAVPLIGVVILNLLQDNQKITYTGAYEISEFGIPLASIIAFTFSFREIQINNYSHTYANVSNVFNSPYIFTLMILGPGALYCIFVLVIDGILRRHNVDVFISFTISTGILLLINDRSSVIGQIYVGSGCTAFLLRLLGFIQFNDKNNKNGLNQGDVNLQNIIIPNVIQEPPRIASKKPEKVSERTKINTIYETPGSDGEDEENYYD